MIPQNMPAISIDINMFWQIINFFILIVVFNKYLKKPLKKVMKERQEKIAFDLADARKNKEEASNVRKEAEAILKEAKEEAHRIITTSERKAEEKKEEILNDAALKKDKILKSAEEEIVQMREKAEKAIKEDMQTLAVQLAEKIITEKLDSNSSNLLIDDFIDKVGELQ